MWKFLILTLRWWGKKETRVQGKTRVLPPNLNQETLCCLKVSMSQTIALFQWIFITDAGPHGRSWGCNTLCWAEPFCHVAAKSHLSRNFRRLASSRNCNNVKKSGTKSKRLTDHLQIASKEENINTELFKGYRASVLWDDKVLEICGQPSVNT